MCFVLKFKMFIFTEKRRKYDYTLLLCKIRMPTNILYSGYLTYMTCNLYLINF